MEGFRILEITQPSELHVTANQLTIEQQIEPKEKKELMRMIHQVLPDDPANIEGMAAKLCFQKFHPGLVRRNDDPINSVLNYGYTIVRSTIIRDIVCAGFYPAIAK